MRGENRQGRFNIPHERDSIISGTTKKMVNTVGKMYSWIEADLTWKEIVI